MLRVNILTPYQKSTRRIDNKRFGSRAELPADHIRALSAVGQIDLRVNVLSNYLGLHALSQPECPRCPPLSSFQFPIALAVKRLRAASRPV
jgi:hypothetical protein